MLTGIEVPDRQKQQQDNYVDVANWNTEQANAAENALSNALLIPASILVGLAPFNLETLQQMPIESRWGVYSAWVLFIVSMAFGALHFRTTQRFHRANRATALRYAQHLKDHPKMTDEKLKETDDKYQKENKGSSSPRALYVQVVALISGGAFYIGFMAGQLLSY